MDQISLTTTEQAAGLGGAARDEFTAKVDFTIGRAQQSLIKQQHPAGYWQAPLEANAEMNAEYIIFNRFMEVEPDPALDLKLKKPLLELQTADGSWALFPGGAGDLSTSITAYFALKLTGMRAGDEPMMQARRWIMSQGGIANAGTLARFYLAAMNQVTWDATPALPVEITLLPSWFPVNMYELSSWARGTLFALMVLQATRPVRPIDWRDGALELYIQPPHFTKFATRKGKRLLSLRNALRVADKTVAILRPSSSESVAGARDAPRRELAARASGRRRFLGRHPALLSAEPDGAQGSGLPQRPSGDRQGARGEPRADLGSGRFRPVPAVRLAELGHGTGRQGAARLRHRRATIRRYATRPNG